MPSNPQQSIFFIHFLPRTRDIFVTFMLFGSITANSDTLIKANEFGLCVSLESLKKQIYNLETLWNLCIWNRAWIIGLSCVWFWCWSLESAKQCCDGLYQGFMKIFINPWLYTLLWSSTAIKSTMALCLALQLCLVSSWRQCQKLKISLHFWFRVVSTQWLSVYLWIPLSEELLTYFML